MFDGFFDFTKYVSHKNNAEKSYFTECWAILDTYSFSWQFWSHWGTTISFSTISFDGTWWLSNSSRYLIWKDNEFCVVFDDFSDFTKYFRQKNNAEECKLKIKSNFSYLLIFITGLTTYITFFIIFSDFIWCILLIFQIESRKKCTIYQIWALHQLHQNFSSKKITIKYK